MARIAHAATDGMFNGLVKVCVFQHDKRVTAAQLQRGFFQVLARLRRDDGTCTFAACQCHTSNAWVFNDLGDLVFGDEQVGIRAIGSTGFLQQLLKSQRALRHAGGMLDHHHIACHQVGCGEAGNLVVRVIPGLDPKQNTYRATFHHGLASGCGQLLSGQKGLGMVSIVVKNSGAQRDFAQALRYQLAHLQGNEFCKGLRPLAHQGCGTFQDHRTRSETALTPVRLETCVSALKFFFKLSCADIVKGFFDFAGVGVGALVGHGFFFKRELTVTGQLDRLAGCQTTCDELLLS